MRGSLLTLSFIAMSLAWLVFFGAGVRQTDWNASLLSLGAVLFSTGPFAAVKLQHFACSNQRRTRKAC